MAHLSIDDRFMMLFHYERLLTKLNKIELQFNSVKDICDHYGVAINYPAQSRKRFLESETLTRHTGSGRPVKDKQNRTETVVNFIRVRRNASLRDISAATEIPKSTVKRLLDTDEMLLKNKRWCPSLTEEQREKRLKFCRLKRYNDWCNWIDLDEKIFQLVVNEKVRYHAGSPRKSNEVQSRRNIQQIMCISAVAKPDAEHHFSGLIGIWRVVKEYSAQRVSKNYSRGEIYEKDTTLTADYYCNFMTTIIIPEVCHKMPWSNHIFIQQDNAPPHVGNNTVQRLNDFGDTQHPVVTIINQPPQSPELNLNDLGFFHSLSKRAHKHPTTNLDALWTAVQQNYWQTPPETLLTLWKTKTAVIQSVIAAKGGTVSTPHSGIRRNM